MRYTDKMVHFSARLKILAVAIASNAFDINDFATAQDPFVITYQGVTIEGTDIFSGKISVSYTIGPGPDSVEVTPYYYGCESETSDPLVSIEAIDYVAGATTMTYDILFDLPSFTPDSDHVNHNNGTGVIDFCTRVVTKKGTLEVTFRETNFELSYDLNSNEFVLNNVSASTESLLDVTESVLTLYTVSACYCNASSFECETPPSLNQDSIINVCLKPTTTSGTPVDTLEIFEINELHIQNDGGSGFVYEAIQLDVTDELTTVETNVDTSGISTKKVTTRFVANLFDGVAPGSTTTLSVSGEAGLNFLSRRRLDDDNLVEFDTMFVVNYEGREGCNNLRVGALISKLVN